MPPVYEYKCLKCDTVLEKERPDTLMRCPKCNGAMKRLYSFATTNMPTGAGSKRK